MLFDYEINAGAQHKKNSKTSNLSAEMNITRYFHCHIKTCYCGRLVVKDYTRFSEIYEITTTTFVNFPKPQACRRTYTTPMLPIQTHSVGALSPTAIIISIFTQEPFAF